MASLKALILIFLSQLLWSIAHSAPSGLVCWVVDENGSEGWVYYALAIMCGWTCSNGEVSAFAVVSLQKVQNGLKNSFCSILGRTIVYGQASRGFGPDLDLYHLQVINL